MKEFFSRFQHQFCFFFGFNSTYPLEHVLGLPQVQTYRARSFMFRETQSKIASSDGRITMQPAASRYPSASVITFIARHESKPVLHGFNVEDNIDESVHDVDISFHLIVVVVVGDIRGLPCGLDCSMHRTCQTVVGRVQEIRVKPVFFRFFNLPCFGFL